MEINDAAIGTVSNVASRLCDEAKPSQILISPRVLMAVKDAVTVEAVGEAPARRRRGRMPATGNGARSAPRGTICRMITLVGHLRPSGRELDRRAPHYPVATAAVLGNLREAVNAAAENR